MGDIMNIIKNLKSFLLDQDYYIDIYNKYIHIYSYESLMELSDKLIKLRLKDFKIEIEGENLIIKMMDNKEMLIEGMINNMRFIR